MATTALHLTAVTGKPWTFLAKTATIEPTARTFLERFPELRLVDGGEFRVTEAPTYRLVEE